MAEIFEGLTLGGRRRGRARGHGNAYDLTVRSLIGAASLIGALTAVLVAGSLPAAAQDPSSEQCTCDLQGFNDRTGADVVNAATCVLELRHPWCDIYLAAAEDTSAHRAIIATIERSFSAGSPDEIKMTVLSLYDQYLRAIPSRYDEHIGTYAADRDFIATKTEDEQELIFYCVGSFLANEPFSENTEGLSCSVGSESGWLKLEYRNDERAYLFLFAPA